MKNVAVLCNDWGQFLNWDEDVGLQFIAHEESRCIFDTDRNTHWCITPDMNPDKLRGQQWSYVVWLRSGCIPSRILGTLVTGMTDPYSTKKSKKDQLIEELQQKLKELQEEI